MTELFLVIMKNVLHRGEVAGQLPPAWREWLSQAAFLQRRGALHALRPSHPQSRTVPTGAVAELFLRFTAS